MSAGPKAKPPICDLIGGSAIPIPKVFTTRQSGLSCSDSCHKKSLLALRKKIEPLSSDRWAMGAPMSSLNVGRLSAPPHIADTPHTASTRQGSANGPCRDHCAHDRTPRSHRLFDCSETQQKAAQLVAVGDLSPWEVHPSRAFTGPLSDNGRGD